MANRFGTTSDMIVQPVEENGKTLYLAIDKQGLYLTTKERLDSPLADPNRYTTARSSTTERLEDLGLDFEAIYRENQHLIKSDVKENTRKVNPLKASKRAAKG